MMNTTSIINKFLNLLFFSSLLLYSCILRADPPTRVARLSYLQGQVSFSQAGLDKWMDAILNRPLVNGDSLWVDNNSLAQVQLDTAILGLDAQTELTILNVTDQTAQFQLATGRMCLTVGALEAQNTNEIDTPNLAFVGGTGHYILTVDQTNNTTSVNVIDGAGTVYGENNTSYQLEPGTTYTFPNTDLSNYTSSSSTASDDFTNWCLQTNKTVAGTHISSRVIGYEDLEKTGSWSDIPDYGQAWSPPDVPSNWSPYSDGHWEWIDPWGWTWVDNAPWGFAPYHYGRWIFINGHWFWVPGPANVAPVYAPAMVSFISGEGNDIGWFPLAPDEPYVPWYTTSFNYFTIINVHNGHFHHWDKFHHFWNAKNYNYNFHNRQHGLVAVPKHVFTGAQPVFKNRVKVSPMPLLNKPMVSHPNVMPTPASITGNAPVTHVRPPRRDLTKPILVHTKPPVITAPNPTNPAVTTVVKPPQFNVVKPHRPPTKLILPGQTTPSVPKPPIAPIVRPPIHPMKPITPVNPTVPINPIHPTTPIKPFHPITPVNPVTPVTPVIPTRPAKPIIHVTPPSITITPTRPVIKPPQHFATPPHIVAPVQHIPTVTRPQLQPVIHQQQQNVIIRPPVVHPQVPIVTPQPVRTAPIIHTQPQFHAPPLHPVNPALLQQQQQQQATPLPLKKQNQ